MRDRVTPELALAVLRRDGGCVAVTLGESAMDCWGRNRIEHVKEAARMSKRAEPCMCRLLTLCEGHTEPGMKAGYVWCTANRQKQRDYLAGFGYGPHVEGHVEVFA